VSKNSNFAGRYPIPFNKPCVVGTEQAYMAEAIANQRIAGDGAFSARCHAYLESALPTPRALLTTSCTHALEMAALLLDIAEGDEVIVPSFTFVSTANAFVLRGARIIFADIDPMTLNIDPAHVQSLVTPRTKAVVAMHYAGLACDMDALQAIANAHSLAIVEDNAHGLFGQYKGRQLGTFGCLATQSFHETKNFTCGEGGALIINEPALIERAEIIREKGTNRSQFFRGQVDKYTWQTVGSSYLLSELLAAYLYAQFEARQQIQSRRCLLWERYYQALSNINGLRLPQPSPEMLQPYHLFYLRLPSLAQRQALIAHLAAAGIQSAFHYVPLHNSPMGLAFGARTGDCPITEAASDQLVRLPLYVALSDDQQTQVIESVLEFAKSL
jgi:dTDP-4-amino-4,6-dideoxygalactose transaminase